MSKWHTLKKIQRARLSARKANSVRWKRDRERRDAMAAAAPVVTWRIVERIVAIRDESRVREIVRYEHETDIDWRRKQRWLAKCW